MPIEENTKSLTKQQLASKIWEAANKLRKNIKAEDYKNYIIGFMFYKYLSEKELEYFNEIGGTAEDLKELTGDDIRSFQNDIGYFIAYGDLFSTWKAKGLGFSAKDVADAIEHFYANLNPRYAKVFHSKNQGVFDALDSGLGKLGANAGSRDKAVRDLVDVVSEIPPVSKDYDVLGYVYEYLIKKFSSEAKANGAFYTPAEVSSLISRIIASRLEGREKITLLDGAAGTGGLMLTMGREAQKKGISPNNITYMGCELITETVNLNKMNLFMNGVPIQNIVLRNADTLEHDWPFIDDEDNYAPYFVDAVAENPPYSLRHVFSQSDLNDPRYRKYGVPPDGYSDFAFLLHGLYHLKDDGIMAIVLPHGVLFRGGKEGEIRKNLLLNHNIEAIIGLPSNLFFATGIPVCIIILSKNRKADDVLFIDASKTFLKDKNQNVLRASDVQRIYDAVQKRKDIENFAHLAPLEEIEHNGYNLNIPRYVSSAADEEPYDLYSVMTGEISDKELDRLGDYWKTFPSLRDQLFTSKDGYSTLKTEDLRRSVNASKDVEAFRKELRDEGIRFTDYLAKLVHSNHQRKEEVYEDACKDILAANADRTVPDKYALFEKFSECWPNVENDLVAIENGVDRKSLIPDALVEEFDADWLTMNGLDIPEAPCDFAEMKEDSLNALSDEDKELITKDDGKLDTKKLKTAIKSGEGDTEKYQELQKLIEDEKQFKRDVKNAEKKRAEAIIDCRNQLDETDISELLQKKWYEPIIRGFCDAGENAISEFVGSIGKMTAKYGKPFAELDREEKRLNAELVDMMKRLTGPEKQMEAIQMMIQELS